MMRRLQELIAKAGDVLSEEASGRFKRLGREGRHLSLDSSPTVVVGDIHGDIHALREILEATGIEEKIHDGGWRLLFLGDYGDRGADSIAVYETILGLKVACPQGVALMMGNHEALDIVPLQPHDLPDQLRSVYGAEWGGIYSSILTLQALLPSSAIYGDRVLLVHGGVYPGINRSKLARPKAKELEMVLWNDPFEDAEGLSASPRGAGVRFGPRVTAEALGTLGVELIVRSHSAVPGGFRLNHGGSVLTIFSSKHVYGLENGSYLVLERGKPAMDCLRLF